MSLCTSYESGIFTFDSKGEVMITILASLARDESRSLSENVTSVIPCSNPLK